jgi:cytochrome P450
VTDLEFHGVPMKSGDRILLPTYLAGRDPAQFPNPDVVDPNRRPRHLTFATGIHFCIGAHLARREIRIVLEEILSRFRNIRIPEGETPTWQTDGVWSMTRLPLIWD